MKSVAVLVFIAVVGAVAIGVGMVPTVVDPAYVEGIMKPALDEYHPSGVTCDRGVEVRAAATKFGCLVQFSDGSEAALLMTMDDDGSVRYEKRD